MRETNQKENVFHLYIPLVNDSHGINYISRSPKHLIEITIVLCYYLIVYDCI